jgi:hypothetical protein
MQAYKGFRGPVISQARRFVMRMLLTAIMPHEPFNTLVRKGVAGEVMNKVVSAIKPEAAYFTEEDGHRCGIFVVNVEHPSQVPSLAEPLFLNFNADCKFRIVMTPEDLQRANLAEIGKKWSH